MDSQTGDEQFEALQKFGQDLTAQAAHLDPVRLTQCCPLLGFEQQYIAPELPDVSVAYSAMQYAT